MPPKLTDYFINYIIDISESNRWYKLAGQVDAKQILQSSNLKCFQLAIWKGAEETTASLAAAEKISVDAVVAAI